MSVNLLINGSTYSSVNSITIKDTNNNNIEFDFPIVSDVINSILDGTISGYYINEFISNVAPYTFYKCYLLAGVSFSQCVSVQTDAFWQCSNLQSVYLPVCQTISNNAFRMCSLLSSVYAPNCTVVSNYAFGSCSALSQINLANCITIGTDVFENCSNLSYISFPVCTSIGANAFAGCTSLTQAIFPSCQYVNGFDRCTALSVISFPECISIGSRAFQKCEALTQVSFPKCVTIGPYYVFGSCSNLTNISIPLVTSIGIQAFQYCSKLSIISLPKCEEIGIGTFLGCGSLSKVYCYWNNNLIISSTAFQNCFKLLSLYLIGSNIAMLSNINVFQTTPISNYTTETGGVYGSIFVPASLFDSYKISTNWVTYSSRFASLTDAQVSQIKTQMGIT